MKNILFVGLLLCWVNLSEAQQVTFSKVFSNFPLNPENGWDIKEINNSYILLSAVDCLDGSNNTCCMISKLNLQGEVVWFNTYSFRPGSHTIIAFNDLIYVAGHTFEPNPQYTIYCIDSLGQVLWDKKYGNTLKKSKFPRLARWSDKWVLYGVQDRDINNRPAPILYFVISDMIGNQLEEFYYGENNESTLAIKHIAVNGNTFLASFVYCPDTCFLDLKAGIVSLDTIGNINWELDLPYSYSPYECVFAQVDSNTLAIKWYVDNASMPNYDLTPPSIYFTDMSGNAIDTTILHNQTLKEIRNVEPVWEKGLVGCGYEYPNYLNQSSAPRAGWIFYMGENREILWEKSYIDSAYQGRTFGLANIIPTSDGGYLATGTITNNMTGVWESHNWLLKLDSTGCLDPGCGNINYVSETEEAVFLNGKNIKIYPNPAKDYIQVELPADFDLRQGTYAVLASSSGGIVRREKMDGPSAQINLSGVAPGVYYVMIRRGNEIVGSKKVVVLH